LKDPALREKGCERAERLPCRVCGLCRDGRAAMLEVRVDRAGFNIFDARGAAELCRDPAVVQPELEAIVDLRRLREIVTVNQEALGDLLEGGLLIAQGRPPEHCCAGRHTFVFFPRRTDRREHYSRPRPSSRDRIRWTSG